MKFSDLSEVFARVESTNSRLEKTAILAEFLGKVEGDELSFTIYLALGRLKPLYDSLEFSLAERMVLRTILWSTGEDEAKIQRNFRKSGDLGDTIYELKKQGKKSLLSIFEVYTKLVDVARDEGAGSQERKVRNLGRLLQDLDSQSAKYVVRLVAGKMRLGFSDMTMLDALSWVKHGDKSDRKELERAFNVSADLVKIANVYKSKGVEGLASIRVTPGVPIRPAKAERLGTFKEIMAKLGKMSVEPKLDGIRVQIHIFEQSDQTSSGGLFEDDESVRVRIFSRGMEDVTHQFPDIVEASRELHQSVKSDIIIEGEAMGYDKKKNRFLSFQETVKRKRKHDVLLTAASIPLKVVVFELLYYKEEGILAKPYSERREILEGVFKASDQEVLILTESYIVSDEEGASTHFERFISDDYEGMMCKRLDGVYQAGARNFNWVKYKRAHDDDLLDTIDCVVMGYYDGKGKRQGFGLGAFLVGVKDGEEYKTVAKVGTGLTDDQFKQIYRVLSKIKMRKMDSSYDVVKTLHPDTWTAPELVVEIAADEITKSPSHTAGYALRFPRLVRIRTDKTPADVTTVAELRSLHPSRG